MPPQFTNHEHLGDSGLIHMNGRAYDPDLGRFLSVDPFITFPENGQSLNPYSYVMNNPLKYTDPSGYKIKSIFQDECDSACRGPQRADDLQRQRNYDSNGADGSDSGGDTNDTPTTNSQTLTRKTTDRNTASKCGKSDTSGCNSPSRRSKHSKFPLVDAGLPIPIPIPIADFITDWIPVTAVTKSAYEGIKHIQKEVASGGSIGPAVIVGGIAIAVSRRMKKADDVVDVVKEGTFSIIDWTGYPSDVPKPPGTVNIIEGQEYTDARRAVGNANDKIRRQQNLRGIQVDVHELTPVKFGGDPVDPDNKIILK